MLGREEVRLDQQTHSGVELRFRHVFDALAAGAWGGEGVVDQYVQPAELRDGTVDHGLDVGRNRYVRQHSGRAATLISD